MRLRFPSFGSLFQSNSQASLSELPRKRTHDETLPSDLVFTIDSFTNSHESVRKKRRKSKKKRSSRRSKFHDARQWIGDDPENELGDIGSSSANPVIVADDQEEVHFRKATVSSVDISQGFIDLEDDDTSMDIGTNIDSSRPGTHGFKHIPQQHHESSTTEQNSPESEVTPTLSAHNHVFDSNEVPGCSQSSLHQPQDNDAAHDSTDSPEPHADIVSFCKMDARLVNTARTASTDADQITGLGAPRLFAERTHGDGSSEDFPTSAISESRSSPTILIDDNDIDGISDPEHDHIFDELMAEDWYSTSPSSQDITPSSSQNITPRSQHSTSSSSSAQKRVRFSSPLIQDKDEHAFERLRITDEPATTTMDTQAPTELAGDRNDFTDLDVSTAPELSENCGDSNENQSDLLFSNVRSSLTGANHDDDDDSDLEIIDIPPNFKNPFKVHPKHDAELSETQHIVETVKDGGRSSSRKIGDRKERKRRRRERYLEKKRKAKQEEMKMEQAASATRGDGPSQEAATKQRWEPPTASETASSKPEKDSKMDLQKIHKIFNGDVIFRPPGKPMSGRELLPPTGYAPRRFNWRGSGIPPPIDSKGNILPSTTPIVDYLFGPAFEFKDNTECREGAVTKLRFKLSKIEEHFPSWHKSFDVGVRQKDGSFKYNTQMFNSDLKRGGVEAVMLRACRDALFQPARVRAKLEECLAPMVVANKAFFKPLEDCEFWKDWGSEGSKQIVLKR